MITPSNLRYHELLSLYVRVIDSSINGLVDQKGKIVMETKNMLYFDNGERVCMAPKKVCTFEFALPSGQFSTLPGSILLGRPEVRLSRLR